MSKGMDAKFRQFSYEMETTHAVNLGIKKMLNMWFCLEMRYLKIQSKSNSLSVYKQTFQLTRTIEVCNFQTIHGAPVYIDAIYV